MDGPIAPARRHNAPFTAIADADVVASIVGKHGGVAYVRSANVAGTRVSPVTPIARRFEFP
jgi:hypothetical protein